MPSDCATEMRWDGKRWALHPFVKASLHDGCRGPLTRLRSVPVPGMGMAVRSVVRCEHGREFTLPVGALKPWFEEVAVCRK